MKHRLSGARVLLGSMLSVVCVVSASAAGWKAPRTPDGKPDLQGNWTNATLTQLERSPAQGDRKVLTAEEALAGAHGRAGMDRADDGEHTERRPEREEEIDADSVFSKLKSLKGTDNDE